MRSEQIINFVQNLPNGITITLNREFELTLARMIMFELITHMEKTYQRRLNDPEKKTILMEICAIGGYKACEFIFEFNRQVEQTLSENVYANFVNCNANSQITDDCYEENLSGIDLALNSCNFVLDALWEELNTGKWSQVSPVPRFIYAYHRWLQSLLILSKIQSQAYNIVSLLSEALKSLDNGLIMSPDLKEQMLARSGALIHQVLVTLLDKFGPNFKHELNSKWKRLITLTENFQKIQIPHPLLNPQYSIEYVNYDLTLFDFENKYFRKKIPFINTNCISHWPCMSIRRWTLPYLLRSMAFRHVPVEIGSKYTDDDWSQKIMPIHQFVEQYILDRPNKIGYMAQYNLFDQILELSRDIEVPDYCAVSDLDNLDGSVNFEINAWFGPAGTVSPLHFDDKHNFLVQVIGTKYIRLYSDKTPAEQIYSNQQGSLLWNTSQVNLEQVDHQLFPEFKKIDPRLIFECILHEGDVLYIPKKFWHFVKATTDSFSINFWWV